VPPLCKCHSLRRKRNIPVIETCAFKVGENVFVENATVSAFPVVRRRRTAGRFKIGLPKKPACVTWLLCSTSKTRSLESGQCSKAWSVKEVSVFRFQRWCFFFLTPDTPRLRAWHLTFCSAPPLQQNVAEGERLLKPAQGAAQSLVFCARIHYSSR
jgi:hypothetical protein